VIPSIARENLIMDNILIIDKPSGITSHDVVDFVRRKLGIKKVGHCGTLDPMATGVIVILTGKATKLSAGLSSDDKEYICRLSLGASTDTHDSTGNIVEKKKVDGITEKIAKDTIFSFKGKQKQIPPMVSAKHHNGQRLYKLARKGIVVQRKPVDIEVKDIDIISISGDSIELKITCSKGTYIRTLCHDIGKKLGCGAHMSALRRMRSGVFHIKDAKSLKDI
jgi:tRNA pseudouridine55 synthase